MTESAQARAKGPAAGVGSVAFGWALHFFILAGVIGAFLRTALEWPGLVGEIVHWRHAHSHVAFLGWVFNSLFALAVSRFALRKDEALYRRLFWLFQIGVVGALIAFPLQGYGAVSIAFSTLHTGATVVFVWKLLRGNRASPGARPFLHWSVFFLLLSAVGPLALGPLAAAGLRSTAWYASSVYFYLHFQYNGWFVFFLLAVFWDSFAPTAPKTRVAAGMLGVGTVLTFGQSLLWLGPSWGVALLGGVGAVFQLAGLAMLFPVAFQGWRERRPRAAGVSALLALAAGALLLKCLLQGVAVLPPLSDLVSSRAAIIGFLHLVFLGVVTPALLAYAREQRWLGGQAFVPAAAFLMAGALATGLLLGLQAIAVLTPLHAERGLLVAAGVMVLAGLALLSALRFPKGENSWD